MLKLSTCEVGPQGEVLAHYAAFDGKAKGELKQLGLVTLVSGDQGANATVSFDAVQVSDEESAFEAVAGQLEAMAKAIRARGEPTRGVPVYG